MAQPQEIRAAPNAALARRSPAKTLCMSRPRSCTSPMGTPNMDMSFYIVLKGVGCRLERKEDFAATSNTSWAHLPLDDHRVRALMHHLSAAPHAAKRGMRREQWLGRRLCSSGGEK